MECEGSRIFYASAGINIGAAARPLIIKVALEKLTSPAVVPSHEQTIIVRPRPAVFIPLLSRVLISDFLQIYKLPGDRIDMISE